MYLEYDFLFKILFIGNSGTGKSAIVNRYVDEKFDEEFTSTIGVDFKIKSLIHNENIIKLQIWDTAGQERFKTITSNYYRGVQGIILVFDLTDKNSYEKIDDWLKEIDKNCDSKHSTIIIGNKSDIISERLISFKEAKEYVEKLGFKYCEVSAKTNSNIDYIFEILLDLIFEDDCQTLRFDKNIDYEKKLNPVSLDLIKKNEIFGNLITNCCKI